MLLEILAYFIASLIIVPVCWYIGYVVLKRLGYEITKVKEENLTE